MKAGTRRFLIILFAVLVLFLAAFGVYRHLLDKYRVENVLVEGNVHYTDEEIKDMVMTGKYGDNSLFLSHNYKNREIKDIPFIQAINVTVESENTIRIVVYEKALAGFIEYLGRYIYFDKDGIVVESSMEKTKGIPQVVGISFDYVIMYEPLPAKDAEMFDKVLDINQLMTKYNVNAEKIYFTALGDIILYKDNIVINLGEDKDLDLKIMNLPTFLDNVAGKSGTLRMEDYSETNRDVTFETNGVDG